MSDYPNILSIAGSDSGGGAGIQADLKTITVLRAYGLSVITALTAQNGTGVSGIQATPEDFVSRQYTAVREGFKIAAAKTGMLCNRAVMLSLLPLLRERDFPLVVDPVCVSQSGHSLLEASALDTLRESILPLADLLTPNIPEAEALTGLRISGRKDLEPAALRLHELGAGAVLIKGGHARMREEEETRMTDWLSLKGGPLQPLSHRRVSTPNNHGTGCALSAAIAVFLGQGENLENAVRRAQSFLVRALEKSFSPGSGAGPVNFLAGAGLDQNFLPPGGVIRRMEPDVD
ncbi:MAG: bifunctional hydroxymethylpyrimidine kinase/phosphomethylpyrimidine kinase [Deltaproteobacteria bacterium]|jgi:hydroxymethylpyrimidine/phosphomethylpyrimidine kinase|nr:bifunctional hydroxymethylpyrimidine kinase/phosphomethylpyrimidine kinase [Deltaproteobacteria bacterium]